MTTRKNRLKKTTPVKIDTVPLPEKTPLKLKKIKRKAIDDPELR